MEILQDYELPGYLEAVYETIENLYYYDIRYQINCCFLSHCKHFFFYLATWSVKKIERISFDFIN